MAWISGTRKLSTASQFMMPEKVEAVYVKLPEMKKYQLVGNEGDNLLDILTNSNVEFPGFGACEGTLACSTCHVYFDAATYAKIEADDPPTDEELDMLDLAFEPSDTSRLCCQVILIFLFLNPA